MNNALYRTQDIKTYQAVPGTPGVPARTYTTKEAARHYVCDRWELVREGEIDYRVVTGNNGGVRSGYVCMRGHWETTYEDKTVYVPAIPGTDGSPAQTLLDPPKGWNSFARSIKVIDSFGYCTFSVPSNATGVMCGLAPEAAYLEDGLPHVARGVLFTGNQAFSAKTGELLDSYAGADVWKVRSVRGTVEIYRNGVLLATESTDEFLGENVVMAASLYWSDSYVFNPALVQEQETSSLAATLPSLKLRIAAADTAELTAVLPALTASIVAPPCLFATLPALQAKIWARDGAELGITLPALTASIVGGMPTIVEQGYLIAALPRLSASIVTEKPRVAEVEVTLPALRGQIMGDMAVLSGTLPALTARIRAKSEGMLEIDSTLGVYPFSSLAASTLIKIASRGRVSSALVAQAIVELALDISAQAEDALDFDQALLLAIDAVLTAGDLPVVPVTGATWVYGTQSGATSRYTFGFNSFAKIGGKFYGASEDGLYLLEGCDDDGQKILATIGYGRRDFGTSALKAVTECYVGVSSAGRMYLRMTANGQTFTYSARAFKPSMREQRIDAGKGMRASMIDVELVSEHDFELDSVEFRVVPLNRRIQS